MFENLVMLQFGGFGGGNIQTFLFQLQSFGVFDFFLPFLLIFALIWGVLSKAKFFGEDARAVNAIIAIVVALLSLQFDFVPRFFAEVFPRFGVGITVLLLALIFLGMFLPHNNGVKYGLFGFAVVALIFVLYNSGFAVSSPIAFWWQRNWGWVISLAIFLILLGIIVNHGRTNEDVPTWWSHGSPIVPYLPKKKGS